MVIDANIDDLVRTLNKINPAMIVGSGQMSHTGKSILFEVCGESPELIHNITRDLNCKGFSDTGSWCGNGYFKASDCGSEYHDYTAKWADWNQPDRRDYDAENPDNTPDEEMLWDAFITVIDNQSKEVFHTGEGAVSYDAMQTWQTFVNTH